MKFTWNFNEHETSPLSLYKAAKGQFFEMSKHFSLFKFF